MPDNWWTALYDELLADIVLIRNDKNELERTLRFLQEQLVLAPGARVYDQCCGIGGLALPLANMGYQVIGVDQSGSYIERAKLAARREHPPQFYVADAREFICQEPCHAAFNWWTSFGYALSDDENMKMLRCAYDSLRPGARMALDYMHAPGILRSFQPQLVTRRSSERGEVILIRDSTIDLMSGTVEQLWSYLLPDGQRVERTSSVRLYMPRELRSMLQEVGFTKVEFYGGVDGEALGLDSRRCIAVAERGD